MLRGAVLTALALTLPFLKKELSIPTFHSQQTVLHMTIQQFGRHQQQGSAGGIQYSTPSVFSTKEIWAAVNIAMAPSILKTLEPILFILKSLGAELGL